MREAEEDVLIVADGFSCREQIRMGTARRALHTAEVLHRALGPPARPYVDWYVGSKVKETFR